MITSITQDEEYSVYGMVHPIDLMALYVGISVDVEQRRKQHFSQKAWLRDMAEAGIPPVTILLEQNIHGIKIARKYEAYWIKELLKKGHPLQNIQGNAQREKLCTYSIFQAHFATLSQVERRRLLTINALSIAHFGLRYGEVFQNIYLNANHWGVDSDKHYLELAELALKACEISIIEDEDERIRIAVKECTRLIVEEGMDEEAANEEVLW